MATPTTEGPAANSSPDATNARASISKRVSASTPPPAAVTDGSPPSSQPRKSVVAGGAEEPETSSPASQPRKSVTAGAAGVSEESTPSSQPRKSVVAGAPGASEESDPSSEARKSVVAGAAGATEGAAPSSQPRKSVAAGADGVLPASSEPRKSVVGEATGSSPSPNASSPSPTGAEPGSSPTQASPTSSQHPQSSGPSTPSKELPGEPVKKTPPTPGWDYSQPLPNRFFRPSLTDLCFPVLAKNFAKFPGFGNLPADERHRVVDEIALDLPLKLAADLIPEEAYWKRRVQSKWRNCDINAHGRSWKQLFFERNLAEALERFDRTVDKESDLEKLMKTSAPYVHNLDIVELPSHINFLLLFNLLERDLAGLRVNFGNPNCGWNYNRQKWGIKRSDCLSLSAALSVTATLTSLDLSNNRIDAEKMGIIAKGLMANPTVVDLDLSSNFLADDGVREVAKVVKANNSVLGMLNLARNRITAQGCVYLAECEDVNKSLVSLNLCFNQFGDLGGKRIIDWANNSTNIQKLNLEACDIGEDSAQSFVRLMHSTHSALTSINMSGNHAIGPKNGELLLDGLEAGKQMKELWISNCRCGEELEKKMLTFLVERLFGRTCYHHAGVRLEEFKPQAEVAKEVTEDEAKKKAEEEAKKTEEEEKAAAPPEGYEEDEEEKKQRLEREAKKKAEEEEAAAAAAVAEAEAKALEEARAHEAEEMIHVGHSHGEACTLECARMVGLPSTKPPPEPVVYPENLYASREAQAAIKQMEDSKPYWGLESIKDLKEKGS